MGGEVLLTGVPHAVSQLYGCHMLDAGSVNYVGATCLTHCSGSST